MQHAFRSGDRDAGVAAFIDYVFNDLHGWDKMSEPARRETLRDAHEWDVMMTTGILFPDIEPPTIRKITAPVLLLSGAQSYPFLGLITEELARLLPNCESIVLPHAGHQMWYQDPDACRKDVEVFLVRIGIQSTKAKVRNVMHGIFAHACRHEWLQKNPISLVRQGAKREKAPDVLDAEELRKLLAELQNPARVLVFLTAATGLRVSEALGLKWSDVEFGTRMINLSRAVVHQHVSEMKTEVSQKPVPMAGALANALLGWSGQRLIASPKMNGKQPYWPETLLKCYVQPSPNT